MLSPQHRRDLHESGLTDETIAAAGFRTSTDPVEIGRILNWKGPAQHLGPSLVIPFLSMANGELNGFARIKPSTPITETNKKTGKVSKRKYEQPIGVAVHAYVTSAAYDARNDPSIPLVITEGEKKALAIAQAGIAAIGLTGVSAWSKKRPRDKNNKTIGPRELNDDLAAFAWNGRPVSVVFDSDPRRNPDVNREAIAFTLCLLGHGAKAIHVVLPFGPSNPNDPKQLPGKMGVDDFIVREGAQAFSDILSFSREADNRDHLD